MLHVQHPGRTLSLQHVRSRSDECVIVGRWIVMCSAPKGVRRVRCKATALEIRTFASVLTTPQTGYFLFSGAFLEPISRNPKKLRKVTFELRLSYEKLRKLEKVTNELRKSYEQL